MSTNPNSPETDVRMRGFTRRSTVEQALAWLDAQLRTLASERLPLTEVAGRVLAASVTSAVDVPGFDRAMMDGFAVQAASVEGATQYNHIPLEVIGQALPGAAFGATVARAQAVKIMTGAPIPAGADAVLPAELAQTRERQVFAHGEVSPGKNIGRRGEDITAGTKLLEQGRALRPQDVGLLSSVGVADVDVVRRPSVRIVVTGNELLPAGTPPQGYQIADANGPMLSALVVRDGGRVASCRIVPDHRETISGALSEPADVVLVSGGSSVGQEDYVPVLLSERGELAVHGVAMRPSSPTGMGRLDGRLVFLLPGNPVSCLCAYDFFAGRAIRALGGRAKSWPYRSVKAPLARKISSVIGRLDYARVKLVDGHVEPLSIGGASVLSSTTRADGFVIVAADSEGHPSGAQVEVFLYD